MGVPVASVPSALGASRAPDTLRRITQRLTPWFEVWLDGLYTEVGCNGGLPRVVGRGVVLKDYGDVGAGEGTVGALFQAIEGFVAGRVAPNHLRPLFIGGDRAVTFPIVYALALRHPGLRLVVLDAHNDLFYVPAISYNHTAVGGKLLLFTPGPVWIRGWHGSARSRGNPPWLGASTCMPSVRRGACFSGARWARP